jgi:MFS family permease
MLSLLLDTYLPFDRVDELTDLQRFPGRQQIEDHLLARVLPVAYTPRPGHPTPPCTPQQAQQWLSYLAGQMNHTGTRDLAWWRIPKWLPPRQLRLSLGLASGLAVAVVAGLAFGLVAGFAVGLVLGITAGLAFGFTTGLTVGRAIGLMVGLTVGLAAGLEFGLTVGLAAGLEFGLELGLAAGLAVGFGAGLTVAVTVGLTSGLTSGLDTAAYDGFPPQYRGLKRRSRLTIGYIAVGLTAGLVFGLVFGLAGQLVFGFTAGLAPWLMGGAAAGPASGLMSGLTQALSTSLPADKLVTPIDSWQGNRRLVIALGLVAGTAVGVIAGLTFGVAIGAVAGMTVGITAGLAFGLLTGITAGLTGAATNVDFFLPAHTAFVLLRRAGRGPARMMDFLEDARRRGVLRTAGPVYQFRHARLQDLLAGVPRSCEGRP